MLHFRILLASGLLVSAFLSAGAEAQVYWNDPAGGSFGDLNNWLPTQVPGVSDTAVFNLDAGYTVDFSLAPTNSRLLVRDGTLLFVLGGQIYTLTSTGDTSVVVGQETGDIAELMIRSGTLAGQYGTIGAEAGSQGNRHARR